MAKMNFAQRIKQKAKEAEFQGGSDTLRMKDGVSFYKPSKGKNEIIIVPFVMGPHKNMEEVPAEEIWFRFQILKHFRVGPEDKSVICPRTIGKRCPICEHRAALISQGKGTDDPEVRDLTAKKRELYYVLDLADDNKLKVYECSYHVFGRRLEEEIREAEDDSVVANFAHPENGAIVSVRMTEASVGKTKFLEASRFDFDKRDEAENKLVARAMEDLPSFGDLIVVKSYGDLKTLFYDLDSDEENEPDEVVEEPVEEIAPRARARAEVEEDSDEENELVKPRKRPQKAQDDEDGEEIKPTRKRAKVDDTEDEEKPVRRRAPRVEEDSDEDEEPVRPAKKRAPAPQDDEDGEEEPTPPKKSPAKKQASPECPGDGQYGQSCDEIDECEDCEHWSACRDLTDEFLASKKKK